MENHGTEGIIAANPDRPLSFGERLSRWRLHWTAGAETALTH